MTPICCIQELEAEDLLETIERGVRQRRFGSVVRVTVNKTMPEPIRDILIENMNILPTDLYPLDPPVGMSDLLNLYALDRYDLKDPPFTPGLPPALAESDDIFSAIRRQDILLHTIRTIRLPPLSIFSWRRPAIPTSSRSSRRYTGWAATRRLSRRYWKPPPMTSRSRC